jgi:hypothetical protein
MAIVNGLKPIESQAASFQKTIYNSTSNLSGNKLLYTYAERNKTTTPYGNLFRSFNFPITSDEITTFNGNYIDTALEYLNVDKIIVVEIPKGEYGELIDGKTFQLTLPVTLNNIETATTVYGTYFGYNGLGGTSFIRNLDKQLSEKNSNYFGFTPSAENDYNTNVTFLYSNDVINGRPKNKGDMVTILTATTFTINNPANNKYTFTTVTFSTNDLIKIEITPINNISDIKFIIDGYEYPINSNDFVNITQPGITSVNPQLYQIGNPVLSKDITVTIKQIINYDLSWDAWSPTNKFPTVEADESKKIYAAYDGVILNNTFLKYYDKPVGILYNDKGFAVITDPTLVSGFTYSAGTSSGFNTIPSGSPYNSGIDFAKIYFTSSTLSNSQFDSITTEFVQNIICIAGANEFVSTTNTSYQDAYDINSTDKPTFITSIGLYNEAQELIGIAKLSEPIKKLPSNIVPFNIRLII